MGATEQVDDERQDGCAFCLVGGEERSKLVVDIIVEQGAPISWWRDVGRDGEREGCVGWEVCVVVDGVVQHGLVGRMEFCWVPVWSADDVVG